ncbi:unnamed protein product, partial [Iphiclides podalirius]
MDMVSGTRSRCIGDEAPRVAERRGDAPGGEVLSPIVGTFNTEASSRVDSRTMAVLPHLGNFLPSGSH